MSPRSTAAFLFAAVAAVLGLQAGAARAQGCDVSRPIVFAGLDYDSAQFHNALARFILTEGYGCKTDAIPGGPIPLVNGMARGDVDVNMEIWTANPVQAWIDAEKAGKVVSLGTNFPDAREAWYVPRYVVEGDDAPAKGLKSVADLPKFKALFDDPEEPGKGRFYNCPSGWQCEVVNSKKLKAYGLAGDYTNFRSGTGEALAAAVEGAIKRKKPILFYYYGPTWLVGQYDLVALDEPPFDKAIWDELQASDAPTKATAYPVSDVIVGVNKAFAGEARNVVAFLTAYETTSAIVSQALATMHADALSPEEAAKRFLKEQPDLWRAWVPQEIAARVAARL
jgi:glycine betaine/proline transport system substrate-binding protein